MSEQKQEGLPVEIYKSECLDSDESKYESVQKDPPHDEGKRKTVNCSKQQKVDSSEDPLPSKERDIDSVLCLTSENVRVLLQAILVACRDTKLSIEDIIQSLGISKKTKSDVLKTIINRCIDKDSTNRDWIGNIGGEGQTSGNYIFARRYANNNYTDIQNTLSITFDNVIASDCFTHKFQDSFLRAQRENDLQNLSNVGCFLVAPDGDGDNDPERTKLTVDPKPLGRSSSLVAPVRYLINLGTKKEIHTEVLTKEHFMDISKTIKPSIDKPSWNQKSEEVHKLLKYFANFIFLYFILERH